LTQNSRYHFEGSCAFLRERVVGYMDTEVKS
jgi:hypothetical protein